MEIIYKPDTEPHDCARGLWSLADLPLKTVVRCDCGKAWKCIKNDLFTYALPFRKLKPHYNKTKLWTNVSIWDY